MIQSDIRSHHCVSMKDLWLSDLWCVILKKTGSCCFSCKHLLGLTSDSLIGAIVVQACVETQRLINSVPRLRVTQPCLLGGFDRTAQGLCSLVYLFCLHF